MHTEIISEVAERMESLPYNLQERALQFIRKLNLSEKNGVHGKSLLKYAGSIPLDDLKIMSEAIENDCRKIDIVEELKLERW